MTLKYVLCAWLCLCLAQLSNAQLEELEQNPNHVWIAEAHAWLSVDVNMKSRGKRYIDSENLLLKYVDPTRFEQFGAPYTGRAHPFVEIIFALLEDEKAVLYEDEELTKPLTKKQLDAALPVDTIITFDPDTFEEIVQVVVNAWSYEDVVYYKIKQHIYYNQKTKKIGVQPVALAPIIKRKGTTKPLFWIPITVTSTIELTNPDLTWVNRTAYYVFEKDATQHKTDFSFKEVWDDCYPKNKKEFREQVDYYHVKYPYNRNLDLVYFTKEEQADYSRTGVDSVITFNPDTFEEVMTVYEYENKNEFIEGLILLQDWAWDGRQQKLYIKQLGQGSIANKYILNGEVVEEERYVPGFIQVAKPK